jgi:small-conductance mechanosensitive channel
MEELLSADRWMAIWNTVYGWLLANVLVLGTGVQVVVVVLTLLLAMLLARRVAPWLARYRDHRSVGRGVVIAEALAFSVLWFALLWLATTVVGLGEQPNGLLSTAATLLAAWIAIHLASQFVRHRTWAKLISWAAWSIAALSILDLLEPTIAVLDAAAITIGNVTISLYDVLRSTIALAVLLSVALYLASLLEARIRTSQTLSPTVQVLFTKSLKMVLVSFAVIFAINAVGIDLTGLAVLGGLAVVALGFGLQKIVSNLISGVTSSRSPEPMAG